MGKTKKKLKWTEIEKKYKEQFQTENNPRLHTWLESKEVQSLALQHLRHAWEQGLLESWIEDSFSTRDNSRNPMYNLACAQVSNFAMMYSIACDGIPKRLEEYINKTEGNTDLIDKLKEMGNDLFE